MIMMSLPVSLQDPAQGLQTAPPSTVTGLLKSFGGFDIPGTIIAGYFNLMYKNTVISPFIIRLNVQNALEKRFI